MLCTMINKLKYGLALIFISAVALFLLIVIVVAGPFIYNYHLSPLARLRNDIQIGQKYEIVDALCTEYYEKYREGDEIYKNLGDTKDLTAKPSEAPVDGKYIHLYHWIFLDDLQLTVFFDVNNKVAHVAFLGD